MTARCFSRACANSVVAGVVLTLLLAPKCLAQSDSTKAAPTPQEFSKESAIRFALENNPEIASIRSQYGIASAAVLIAETYPFNPLWEARVRGVSTPSGVDVTSRVVMEHNVLTELEIRGQRGHRRQSAYAALNRTQWEIAFREEVLAVRALRFFDAVIYRREKLKLIQETIRLNESTANQVRDLRQANKLTAADLILAQTEVDDARSQLGAGRAQVAAAGHDLRRTLGLREHQFELRGTLDGPTRKWTEMDLLSQAQEYRADLRARQAAVAEADHKIRLACADRYGNPVVGTAYEYNEARVHFIGVQANIPIAVFNTRRGEVQQRQNERAKAALELRETELAIAHDVEAALDRWQQASASVATYRTTILPNLQTAVTQMEGLLSQAAVDVLKVIDVRRKLLKARDGYLDALFEMTQAEADLAAAVGNPALATAK